MTMFLALSGAALGWSALALQFVLTLDTMGTLPAGLWRFIGYFTIIANTFSAFVLTRAVMGRSTARMEFAAVTAMILVGIVYSLLLRDTWNPQGWQKVADVALHDLMPLLTTFFWLLRPHRRVGLGDVAASLVLPLGYLAWGVARGAIDGWYAYGFMDVAQLGVGPVMQNCAGMGLAFLMMALALAALDRILP
jgi:hypothetical protein